MGKGKNHGEGHGKFGGGRCIMRNNMTGRRCKGRAISGTVICKECQSRRK